MIIYQKVISVVSLIESLGMFLFGEDERSVAMVTVVIDSGSRGTP